MNQTIPIIIGIDGGGTYSFGVAANFSGEVLARSRSGSLNFFGSGLAQSRRNLNELVKSLQVQLPLGTQLRRVVIGSAALSIEATPEQKQQLCRNIVPLDQTRLVSDCITAYSGICLGKPGVLVVAGTGSIVLAKSEEGDFCQVGGWGHLLGDEGGAYWIAIEAIKSAIAAAEGFGPQTALIAEICRLLEVKELSEIIPILYQPGFSKEKFAALAQQLATGGCGDDPVFQDICRRAGHALATQALAAADGCGLESSPLPVFINGSVLKNNALVRESMLATLSSHRPAVLETPRLLPLLGAATLALTDAGVNLSEEVIEKLRVSHERFASEAAKA
ncbi:MAG TPA: BadF/BadG/BcrA/BcrD ATPase family protein [Verrucomicrobiae bacterium]|nr:BadF/BadG/BcrA/BcrD ATPase family protein [Verrucomicrobiae bacterium]